MALFKMAKKAKKKAKKKQKKKAKKNLQESNSWNYFRSGIDIRGILHSWNARNFGKSMRGILGQICVQRKIYTKVFQGITSVSYTHLTLPTKA